MIISWLRNYVENVGTIIFGRRPRLKMTDTKMQKIKLQNMLRSGKRLRRLNRLNRFSYHIAPLTNRASNAEIK